VKAKSGREMRPELRAFLEAAALRVNANVGNLSKQKQ
jgi:hypothetical protein